METLEYLLAKAASLNLRLHFLAYRDHLKEYHAQFFSIDGTKSFEYGRDPDIIKAISAALEIASQQDWTYSHRPNTKPLVNFEDLV